MTYQRMSLNPYQSPQTTNDEPVVDLSRADALEKHKQEFARELARQRMVLRLCAITLTIVMASLMLWPLVLSLLRR